MRVCALAQTALNYGARCTKNSIAVIACGLNGVACEAHNTPITGLIAMKTSPFMIHIGEKTIGCCI
jgi:hypothetical protein